MALQHTLLTALKHDIKATWVNQTLIRFARAAGGGQPAQSASHTSRLDSRDAFDQLF